MVINKKIKSGNGRGGRGGGGGGGGIRRIPSHPPPPKSIPGSLHLVSDIIKDFSAVRYANYSQFFAIKV